MVEEHQREQPARLRLLGGEGELAGEPDRLAGQVDPARVAGRVDEVEHAQHDGEVAGLVQAAPAQGALGAADPLRHRRLGDVEGVGDLAGGEAADGAQGQRHLGGGREVGVAAAEEQEEGVVALLGGGRRAARRTSPPRGAGGRPRCGGRRRAAGSRPWSATRAGRAAGARATPAAPPAAPPAARPRRRRSPRPAGPGPASTRGTRARSAPSSSRRVGSSITPRQSSEGAPDMTSRTSIHSYSGSAARAGLGGDVGRELDRALVRLDVDHVPAGDEVAGLGHAGRRW